MNWQRKLELNSLSPYNVENDEHGLVYTFTTEFGVAYSVSFLIPGDLYAEFTPWGKQVYDFSFVPNQTLKVYDRRIERTVIDILLRFFQLQPDGIITFVCDSLDGSEYLRMRLFNQWYFKYNFQSDFSKLDYRGQLDEVKIFTSLVLRKDHAFHQNVSETFYWMCTELYSSDQ